MGSGARQAIIGRSVSVASTGVKENSGDLITFREATAEDLVCVAEIEKASFADPWSAHEFESVLQLGHTIFLVAEAGNAGEIAGYVVAMAVLDEAEILNVAVSPERRRAGLGGALMDAALSELKRRGAQSVYLEVRVSNTAARSLYASRGFVELSRRKDYYRSPVEDALVMRRAANG